MNPMSLARPVQIAIEGCVGVGKTTVAQGLAKSRQSRLVIEDFSSVPFLMEFYADPKGAATETEFAFLLQHYHQLRLAGREHSEFISDFAIDKDLIFAGLNIDDEAERSVFIDLYKLLSARVPKVAVTIFMSASDELILERIKGRGRTFELGLAPSYYERLNAAYKEFFARHDGAVIPVSANEMDFCADPTLFEWLSARVDEVLAMESIYAL